MKCSRIAPPWMLALLAFLLTPLVVQADDTATAEAPAAEKNAETDKPESNKYVRILRNDDGKMLSLDTSVVSYIAAMGAAPLQVDLIGAVHVGEKSYYESLNKIFEDYDVVLYELVAPEGTRIERGAKANSRHPLGMLQGGMKDVLKLEHQLEQVDYTKKNFVHADMSPADFAKSMKDRGESFMGMFFRAMGQGVAQQSQQKNQVNDADILLALFSKDRDLKLKQMMAQQFEDLEGAMSAISGPNGSTIIEERNNVALKVLGEQIDAGKKKIAIFYGAGHLPDMHEKLEKDFKLKQDTVRWVPAWKLSR